MKFSRLIEGLDVIERLNWADVDIESITCDSRMVSKGSCFVAIKGRSADGHDFVGRAVASGASALLLEKPIESSVPAIVVRNSGVAAALAAKKFYGDPGSRLVLAGITGTNGKTSGAYLLRSILAASYGSCGIIGTIGYGFSDIISPTLNTTPGSIDLYRILSSFVEAGCKAAVMEVSSHAAEQGRTAGLEFDVGIFTNISRDHLDYHGTLDRYIEAKERFVASLVESGRKKRAGTLVYNCDDENVASVASRFPGSKISFGIEGGGDLSARAIETDLKGTEFDIVSPSGEIRVRLALLGIIAVYNALAAATAAFALGIDLQTVKKGLESVPGVPGRMQVVSGSRGPTVVVDYAHTPDALEKLLRFCRQLSPRRIVTVFGCGGDRDRGKRPLMGDIAARLSDRIYVTDDNPRTEDPDRIVREILEGVGNQKAAVEVIRDRRSAIREAITSAREGDMVVIAGKGHESEQIIARERIPFSDVAVAREVLEETEHEG